MADTKVSALSSFTPIVTDLLYGVDDPGGTPVSGKLTISDIFALAAKSTLAAGTLTADSPHQITQTWNNAGVAFAGLKVDITNTASAAASNLLDLLVGGVSQFSVGKAGTVNVVNFASYTNLQNGGGVRAASGVIWGSASTNQFAIGDSGGATRIFANVGSGGYLQADAGHFIGWGTTAGQAYNAGDTRLYRDAAGTLAQRNGANAQTFNIYNTYTDGSNFERGQLVWSGNVLYLQTVQAGTGTARNLHLRTGGANVLLGGTAGSPAWSIAAANGHFLAGTDNTYDIGASGANRPRNLYVANAARSNEMHITDGITAPSATAGAAKIYVDIADGDLKVVFGDGTIKTLATDT